MAITLVNIDNFVDSGPTSLDGAIAATAATLNGETFVIVAGEDDDGVTSFALSASGFLSQRDNDADNAETFLVDVSAVAISLIDGQPFLVTAGFTEDGLGTHAILANGFLLNVDNIDDADNLSFAFDGAAALATATIDGNPIVFVAGSNDDGISSFTLNDEGFVVANGDNVQNSGPLELNAVGGLTTARVGTATYLFAAGVADDGISVFDVDVFGSMTNVENVDDGDIGALELDGVASLATAVVGNKTFLFSASRVDDGVSVFEVAADGSLTNVDNITNDGTLELLGANSVTTANIAGTTYVFVAGRVDDGVSVFAVAADGSLVNFANIFDAGALELDGASSVTTAVVGSTTFLVVTGSVDDGVSTFRLDVTGLTINGTGGNDIINAVSSAPGQLLPSELGDTINGLTGNDVINALGGADKVFGGGGTDTMTGGDGNDVLTGGNGRDTHFGGLGADRFDFNTIAETKTGSLRDRINDFKRGQADKIDLAGIDAKTGVAGNQKFTFIGKQDFSDTKGELRFENKILKGDVNGDGNADFQIFVNVGNLVSGDFIL